ncbi:hypothetical protein BDB01DRAFT_727276 [Pilobolus umbonatus]|nr:hypothetical protein BDB01DRAFT_727276 [Pilobolus umbonatus]
MLDTVQQPSKSHTWSSILFIIPSGCDLIATTLLNLGLIYTSPSIYQMVKSSIVAFSAIFSALFFSRKFLRVEWIGIASVLAGTVVIVGSITHSVSDYKGPILLLVAQLFVACQFILEEYFMDRFQLDPIKAMGIEGIFGSVMLVVALLLGAVFGSGEFDIHKGVDQLLSHNALWQSALVLAVMVAIFNFFGLVVGSSIAIPGKSVIDTLRTVLTWLVAIYYGWDHFDWIQLSGFIVLIIGIYLFNGVFASCMPKRLNDERTPLLS